MDCLLFFYISILLNVIVTNFYICLYQKTLLNYSKISLCKNFFNVFFFIYKIYYKYFFFILFNWFFIDSYYINDINENIYNKIIWEFIIQF